LPKYYLFLSNISKYKKYLINNYLLDYSGEVMGPSRVWLKDENIPGLAMSRSIGDLVAARVGVISEPGLLVYI
jgi:hypothetical protein